MININMLSMHPHQHVVNAPTSTCCQCTHINMLSMHPHQHSTSATRMYLITWISAHMFSYVGVQMIAEESVSTHSHSISCNSTTTTKDLSNRKPCIEFSSKCKVLSHLHHVEMYVLVDSVYIYIYIYIWTYAYT